MQAKSAVLIVLCAVLAGCKPPPPPAVAPPPPPPLPPHIGPPPAAHCSVAPFKVADGGTATVTMSVSNEGGYCAATLTTAAGAAFDAPLVPAMPAHGTPRVVKYNGQTSVEYTPNTGYVGTDSFVVRLIIKGKPTDTTLNVAVTVGGAK